MKGRGKWEGSCRRRRGGDGVWGEEDEEEEEEGEGEEGREVEEERRNLARSEEP